MKSTAPNTITAGQVKELSTAMTQAIPTDLPFDVAKKWIGRKGKLGERIKKVLLIDDFQPTISQEIARIIMGKNFWGVEDWATFFGVNFTKEQLRKIEKFPYGEDILNSPCPFRDGKSVKDTHFAFLGLDRIQDDPLSIVKWQEICPVSSQLRFYHYVPDAWYSKEKFANEPTCSFRWYLMPLEIIPNSTDKTFEQQKAMLPADYGVPLAIEEVTKHTLYYKKNGIYLNQTKYGRCQDISSDGSRVYVGCSASDGLDVYDWVDFADDVVGLASVRKVQS